ncbi:MAG: hypothetical protein N4A76_07280 [Firmicutes bacterium]|nr:hypothetical protein [Bacillota bacterium]
MKNYFKKIFNKKGMGTIEVVIIIVILVGLALTFQSKIGDWSKGLFNNVEKNIETISGASVGVDG